MTRAAPALELDRLHRAYGAVVAVEDVSISLEKGEFLTLLGPSGSGKTTTLRLIGGFEAPDGGEIRINGAPAQHLPPYLRDTATIFQSGALFPHKTVADNIAFGLRMRGVPRDEIGRRIAEALDIVRLAGKEDRYPEQLSGGQRQRVAIARALILEPRILFLDEPTSALDVSVQAEVLNLLRDIQVEQGLTCVLVSHDLAVVANLCNRLAVMNQGKLVEELSVADLMSGRAHSGYTQRLIAASTGYDRALVSLDSD